MAMVECDVCGCSYNSELLEACPLCQLCGSVSRPAQADEPGSSGGVESPEGATEVIKGEVGNTGSAGDAGEAGIGPPAAPRGQEQRASSGFMSRMEERWRQRTDDSTADDELQSSPRGVNSAADLGRNGISLGDDDQVKRLLAAIVQQNETSVIQLKKVRASLFTVNLYLFLLAVVYPILGLIAVLALSA